MCRLSTYLGGGILTTFENRASVQNYRAKKEQFSHKIKGKYRAKIFGNRYFLNSLDFILAPF